MSNLKAKVYKCAGEDEYIIRFQEGWCKSSFQLNRQELIHIAHRVIRGLVKLDDVELQFLNNLIGEEVSNEQ